MVPKIAAADAGVMHRAYRIGGRNASIARLRVLEPGSPVEGTRSFWVPFTQAKRKRGGADLLDVVVYLLKSNFYVVFP
jgi:hypothetical protein